MNYLLLVVILAVCGAAYYTHTQDQQQITALQAEVDEAQAAAKAAAAKAADNPPEPVVAAISNPANHPGLTGNSPSTGLTHDLDSPVPTLVNNPSAGHAGPHATVVDNPDETHAGSVDAAAEAARAAADSDNLGTVTTLDNHSYTNCHVVKIDQDGVTFSNDDGITKIEFTMMPPDLQKRFGYTPQAAVARTEAEIRADEQQQSVQPAETNATPATP